MNITLDTWPSPDSLARVSADLNEAGQLVHNLIARLETTSEQSRNKGGIAPQRLCMVPPQAISVAIQRTDVPK